MTTGFIWDERFAWFDAGPNRRGGPFYSPMAAYDTRESKERIRELLVASGLVDRLMPVSPRLMTEEELLRYHTPESSVLTISLSTKLDTTRRIRAPPAPTTLTSPP